MSSSMALAPTDATSDAGVRDRREPEGLPLTVQITVTGASRQTD